MNTNFAVSNTDVVTMLMVKQKDALTTRSKEISNQIEEIRVNTLKKVVAQYKKQLEKFDPKIVEAYTQLVKACNPKLKFSVTVGITDMHQHLLHYKRDKDTQK